MTTNRASLSNRGIEEALALSRASKSISHMAAPEPGLVLRLSAGSAIWVLNRRRANGARVPMRLGYWPALSIDQACESARLAKLRFAAAHGKPVKPRPIGSLLIQYDLEKLSSLRSAAPTGRSLRYLFRKWMERDIRSITQDDIQGALRTIASGAPSHANRCLAYGHAFFAWAIDRRHLATNPMDGLEKFVDETARSRVLELAELAEILAAAATRAYPFGPAVQLMMILPFQREIISTVERDELRVTDGVWTWRRPGLKIKGVEGDSVLWRLPAAAAELVAEALQLAPAGSQHLFTGNGSTPISGWSKAKRRLDEVITEGRRRRDSPPLAPWRLNDFRSTFAAHGRELASHEGIVERCLDRSDAFRSPMMIEFGATQEWVDICCDLLDEWAQLVCAAGAEITSANVREAAP